MSLRRFVFFCFILYIYSIQANAGSDVISGQLLDYRLIKSFPVEQLKTFFKEQGIPKIVLPVVNGLNIYEVTYVSTYADNSNIKASGLLYVPMSSQRDLPLMIYNHGTELCRDYASDFEDERSICLAFATDDYIVLSPDYIGLGAGERNQLYLNAASESQTSVDMLQAVEVLLPLLQVKTNKQLFVTGYSQGGHAAMATHRLLQQSYSGQFPVTASAPMSGPYDVESTVFGRRNERFEYPGFMLLLLQSYLETTGRPGELGSLLNPPYDTLLPPLIDGNYPIDEIDKLLPDTFAKAIRPEFYSEFENNPESGFRKFLKENNVFDWKPEAPMLLCYCDRDEEVNCQNSKTAYETMKKNGSDQVQLWRAGKKFGHINCALFAVVYTKMYFDGFRRGKPGNHGPYFKRMLLNIGKLTVKAF